MHAAAASVVPQPEHLPGLLGKAAGHAAASPSAAAACGLQHRAPVATSAAARPAADGSICNAAITGSMAEDAAFLCVDASLGTATSLYSSILLQLQPLLQHVLRQMKAFAMLPSQAV